MTKKEIKEQVALDQGLTKKDTGIILDGFLQAICEGLTTDKKVTIVNFGSFRVVEQKERTARNPRTGESVHVPAKVVVKFKAADNLKKLVK